MATVVFTSSDVFMGRVLDELRATERAEVEVHEYVEATYNVLRTAPDVEEIAHYSSEDAAWVLPDGRSFSDWSVEVGHD